MSGSGTGRRPTRTERRATRMARLGVGMITVGAAVGVCALLFAGSGQGQSGAVTGTSPAALTASEDQEPVTLAFGGDVHFEGVVGRALNEDPGQVLRGVAPVLESADIAVVNLETAVTDGAAVPKQHAFRAPGTAFTALRAAGVDVASMANDHGMDYGVEGLRDSLQAASDTLFPVIGLGADEDAAYQPFVRTVKGQRIAVLAATQVIDTSLISSWTATDDQPGLASAKRVARLLAAVREAGAGADTVVVFLHWGTERLNCPNDAQSDLAHLLAGAGADVIVGGHAHRLQGGGFDGAAYVDYGLGNLAFSMVPSPESADSGILTVTVAGGEVVDAQWHPAVIVDGLPVLREGADAEQAQQRKASHRACTDLAPEPSPSGPDPVVPASATTEAARPQ